MDLDLVDQVALVTGASGGLGRAASVALAGEGARVVGWGRDPSALARTAEGVRAVGGSFTPMEVDLTDEDARAAAMAQVHRELGTTSILVNITGGPPPGPITEVPDPDWGSFFDSMVRPVFALTAAVVPGMRAQGWGRVVTATSSGVVAPIAGLGISNSLRSCLVGWSKTLAGEVGGDGVTSNIVIPGRIQTARVSALDAARAKREDVDVDEVRRQSISQIPVGRYGRPEEFGSVVAFLAGRQASYVTGSTIRVDGGLIRSV